MSHSFEIPDPKIEELEQKANELLSRFKLLALRQNLPADELKKLDQEILRFYKNELEIINQENAALDDMASSILTQNNLSYRRRLAALLESLIDYENLRSADMSILASIRITLGSQDEPIAILTPPSEMIKNILDLISALDEKYYNDLNFGIEAQRAFNEEEAEDVILMSSSRARAFSEDGSLEISTERLEQAQQYFEGIKKIQIQYKKYKKEDYPIFEEFERQLEDVHYTQYNKDKLWFDNLRDDKTQIINLNFSARLYFLNHLTRQLENLDKQDPTLKPLVDDYAELIKVATKTFLEQIHGAIDALKMAYDQFQALSRSLDEKIVFHKGQLENINAIINAIVESLAKNNKGIENKAVILILDQAKVLFQKNILSFQESLSKSGKNNDQISALNKNTNKLYQKILLELHGLIILNTKNVLNNFLNKHKNPQEAVKLLDETQRKLMKHRSEVVHLALQERQKTSFFNFQKRLQDYRQQSKMTKEIDQQIKVIQDLKKQYYHNLHEVRMNEFKEMIATITQDTLKGGLDPNEYYAVIELLKAYKKELVAISANTQDMNAINNFLKEEIQHFHGYMISFFSNQLNDLLEENRDNPKFANKLDALISEEKKYRGHLREQGVPALLISDINDSILQAQNEAQVEALKTEPKKQKMKTKGKRKIKEKEVELENLSDKSDKKWYKKSEIFENEVFDEEADQSPSSSKDRTSMSQDYMPKFREFRSLSEDADSFSVENYRMHARSSAVCIAGFDGTTVNAQAAIQALNSKSIFKHLSENLSPETEKYPIRSSKDLILDKSAQKPGAETCTLYYEKTLTKEENEAGELEEASKRLVQVDNHQGATSD